MKYYKFIFILLFILFNPLTAFSEEKPYNQIIFLGDSLSDNGNLYQFDLKLLPKSPPYFQGRFTNGPTWADLAAEYYAKNNITSQNYAVGGETAYLHNPFEGYLPYFLGESINNYLFRTAFHDRSHSLFIILIGANDYLSGATDVDKMTSQVVQTIKNNIQTLIYQGGRYFLILNLPDLSKTPLGRSDSTIKNLSELTLSHNKKLAEMISQIQNEHKNISLHLFDLNAVVNNLIDQPDVFNQKFQTHITNTTTACWTGGYTLQQMRAQQQSIAQKLSVQLKNQLTENNTQQMVDANQLASFIVSSPDLAATYQVATRYAQGEKPCSNPDDYLFWDHVHPTAVAHTILAKMMIEYINHM